MQTKFSRITNIVYIFTLVLFAWGTAMLSYGWSMQETGKFTSLIFGERWALPSSFVIQFGPQALLILATLTNSRTVRRYSIAGAICLNMLDALTNWGAYRQWLKSDEMTKLTGGETIDPVVLNAAKSMGYLFSFLVTWAEEVLAFIIGVLFHLVSTVWDNAPQWFQVGQNLAEAASGVPLVQGTVENATNQPASPQKHRAGER